MNADDWIDVTTLGSDWQVQYQSSTKRTRYRPVNVRALERGQDLHSQEYGAGDWRYGIPPTP